MEKVARQDVLDIIQYERIRKEFHSYVISLKKKRRISIGPNITIVFENQDTVRHQIQEMMRVERIVEEDRIQLEIDTYNDLIPNNDELAGTLFIEIEDQSNIKKDLERFQGIDQHGMLYIKLDEERIYANFEEGRSKEDKISAVQYIRFRFSQDQIETFRTTNQSWICVDHANYHKTTQITPDIREALAEDFA